jgi:hypothetical protein
MTVQLISQRTRIDLQRNERLDANTRSQSVLRESSVAWLIVTLALVLVFPQLTFPQGQGEKLKLIINGQATQVPVIQVNGQAYVGLQALADAMSGSLSYSGSAIALSVPDRSGGGSVGAAKQSVPQPAPARIESQNQGFSQAFLTAGIEQMSTLREWHAALTTSIEGGIPVSSAVLAPYRAQATTNLRLATVAATTSSDRNALQLLNNEFQNMAKLSDKYVKLRANLAYISPDALQKDDLNRSIVACGHSLGAMAATGQFVDDGSCH